MWQEHSARMGDAYPDIQLSHKGRRERECWVCVIWRLLTCISKLCSEIFILAFSSCFIPGKCRAALRAILQAKYLKVLQLVKDLWFSHLHWGVYGLLCYYHKLQGLYKFSLWLSLNPLNGILLPSSTSPPLGCHRPKPDVVLQKWPPKHGTGETHHFLQPAGSCLVLPASVQEVFLTAGAHCWQRAHTVFFPNYFNLF